MKTNLNNFIKTNFKLFPYVLVFFAFIIRIWKITEWTYFSLDQEYAAFLIMKIVNGVNFPFIGVNASDTGLYLGPGFLYLGSIIYAIGNGNPVMGSTFASILSSVFIYLLWKWGQIMVDRKSAFIAAYLWTFSLPMIWFDRKFWNPSLVPLLSLCVLYAMFKLYREKKPKYFYFGLIALGFGLHSHLQLLLLFPAFVFVSWNVIKNNSVRIMGLGIFLFVQLPQIIFEMSHSFINSRAALQLISNVGSNASFFSMNSLVVFFFSLVRSLGSWGVSELTIEQSPVPALFTLKTAIHPVDWLFVILLFIYVFRFIKYTSLYKQALIIITITTIVAVCLYQKPIADYYFLFFYPMLFLGVGRALKVVFSRYRFLTLSLLLLALTQLGFFFSTTTQVSFSQKLAAVSYIRSELQPYTYRLRIMGNRLEYGGYRYLTEWQHVPPSASSIDSVLGWLYSYNANFSGTTALVVLKTDLTPTQENELQVLLKKHNVEPMTFGVQDVYLIE